MIQVHVQRRKDVVKVRMLQVGEFFIQKPHVMIVYQRYGSDHLAVRALPGLVHQFVANQIAKGFGTVGVAAGCDQVIELLQQFGLDSHANPAELAHSYSQCSRGRRGRQAVTRFEKSCYLGASAAMHIPDNFLSTPVWAILDIISIPVVGLMVKRAGRELEDARVPLLGVMGAFVFAAQMINFPVGVGTSGHLVGGALLAVTLGAAPATIVMTAIIAIQAFVFQDGGVLALGANVFNMAVAGGLAGYLPFWIWGASRAKTTIFTGAFLSVMVSASLALGELLISGVVMPQPLILVSLALFMISALIEGAITISVVQAIENLNPGLLQKPGASSWRATSAIAGFALMLGVAGFLWASSAPDGIQKLGLELGLAAKTGFRAPFADYTAFTFESAWLRKATARFAGLLVVYGICIAVGKMIGRQRSA